MGQLDPEEDNIQEEVERVVAQRYARLDPSFVAAAPDRTGKVELKRIVKELEKQNERLKVERQNLREDLNYAIKLYHGEKANTNTDSNRWFEKEKYSFEKNQETSRFSGDPRDLDRINIFGQMCGKRTRGEYE